MHGMLDVPKTIATTPFETGLWRAAREVLAIQLFSPHASSLTKWETQAEAVKDTYRQRAHNIMRGKSE